jgi:hypothetical protein
LSVCSQHSTPSGYEQNPEVLRVLPPFLQLISPSRRDLAVLFLFVFVSLFRHLFIAGLEVEPRSLHILGKNSTTQPHSQSVGPFLLAFQIGKRQFVCALLESKI